MTRILEISKGLACVLWAGVLTLLYMCVCVCVCVWHEWGSVGYFEWVVMYDGVNAEAKSLMGKGLFMTN